MKQQDFNQWLKSSGQRAALPDEWEGKGRVCMPLATVSVGGSGRIRLFELDVGTG
jgi:hypothetical protein